MRAWILVVVLVLAAAGCGGSGTGGAERATPADAPVRSLFGYDRDAPVGLRDEGVINEGYPIEVRDASFASPRGGRVPAYLVVPPGDGPYPGVVYLHGSGGSRLDLVAPATWLAARRVVGLVVESPAVRARQEIPAGRAGLRQLRDLEAKVIVELRRAVDVLESLPQVDGERLGFVGFSAGARAGALLSGHEDRIGAYVLMSGGAKPPAAYAAAVPAEDREFVRELAATIDPLAAVAEAAPAAVLFQLGTKDEIVPVADLEALARAGSEPKTIRRYDAGHALSARAHRDAIAWLAQRLRTGPPSVPGALGGPE